MGDWIEKNQGKAVLLASFFGGVVVYGGIHLYNLGAIEEKLDRLSAASEQTNELLLGDKGFRSLQADVKWIKDTLERPPAVRETVTRLDEKISRSLPFIIREEFAGIEKDLKDQISNLERRLASVSNKSQIAKTSMEGILEQARTLATTAEIVSSFVSKVTQGIPKNEKREIIEQINKIRERAEAMSKKADKDLRRF